jgi:phosphate-selective porin OprO/OprP
MDPHKIKAYTFVCAVFFSLSMTAVPAAADDEVSELKEQVKTQQKEIQELRAELEEQRKLLNQILPAVQAFLMQLGESSQGTRAATMRGPDSVEPSTAPGALASRNTLTASADAMPVTGPSALQEAAGTEAPQHEMELVKGELEAVAETAHQANLRLAKLEKDVTAATSAGVAGWDGSHAFIRSRDGNLRAVFGGRMHFDWRSYTGTATPPSTFLVRRARLETGGVLYKHYEFQVQFDFADTSSRMIRDAFINVHYTDPFQVQFGHFKAPFSQEELQSSKFIDFVERSSVNNLAPARSPGMMVHGKLAQGVVEYYAGAFNARRDVNLNTASTPEGYVRLRFNPFKSSGPPLLQNFSFGGAFADGRHKGDNSFAGRTASQSTTFFKAVPVNGEIVRANAEFWWRYKRFSLRGEYDQTHQSRENLNGDGINLPGVIGKGLVFQTTYLLTGEEKTEGGITPKMNFLGGQRGLGAWELALRYENLQMHDSVNPNRAEAYTFGINWWLTKFVRYQSNFAYERFKDPTTAPTPGETGHFAYLSRMQVIF